MILTFNMKDNYAVNIDGRNVILNEHFNNSTAVNRMVETIANPDDESAICYIINTDWQKTPRYMSRNYNELVKHLNSLARIINTYSIDTSLLNRNVGAGFTAIVSQENYKDTVNTVRKMMYLTGLNSDYELITRFENYAVFTIIRKH